MDSDANKADAQNIEKTNLPYLLRKYGRPRGRIARRATAEPPFQNICTLSLRSKSKFALSHFPHGVSMLGRMLRSVSAPRSDLVMRAVPW